MKSLRECITDAEDESVAIGHFNISDAVALRAIVDAAQELDVPVVIGTSEGERNFIGTAQSVALVRSYRETLDYPIFLNSDHTHSLDGIVETAKAGYDAVLFDGSKLPFEENVRETKEAVERARSVNPDVLVEGELGYIGSSSRLLEKVPKGAAIEEQDLTAPEQAQEFVERTGVDLLAPAVGNLHGMMKHAANPRLDVDRIKKIRAVAGVPLVLHGGSGIIDGDFVRAIKAGVAIIHINTELRVAWRKGLEEGLKEHKDEIAPYKVYPAALDRVREVVYRRLVLFNKK